MQNSSSPTIALQTDLDPMQPLSDIDTGASVSDAASNSGTSESTNDASNNKKNRSVEQEIIGREEDKAVFRLKLLVLAVLIASTVGIAMVVYFYTSDAEEDDFEEQFIGDSSKIFESIGSTLELTLGAVDSFLVGLVSFARFTNATWPQVTLPDYAVRVAKIRSLSKAVLVTQYHVVTDEQRSKWEKYSVANDYWVDESIEVQKNDETYEGKIVTGYWTRPDIHIDADPYTRPGPYLPKWQQAPVIPIYAPYNWDAMAYPSLANAMPFLVGEQRVVMSEVSNLPDLTSPQSILTAETNNLYIKDFIGEDEKPEPFSDLYYPIIDTAADSVTIPNNNSSTSTSHVVGIFATTFFWGDLLKDILPPGSDGAVVVVENDCNQTFSYKINGASPVYLGRGDRHETKYESFGKYSELRDLDALRDRSYTGLPLSMGGCQYALRVYPSSDMEDDYITSNPIIFTVAAVLIFVFTSVIFLFYDLVVERRQKKVMSTAVRSTAIVSSLFPSNVRDRLFPVDDQTLPSGGKAKGMGGAIEPTKNRLRSFLGDGKAIDPLSNDGSSPIADLFPETTVLFSDISGFTAWSSVREPRQVFTLLENIYGTFDAIAAKRHVFKVETIGDSYVAVTGLPEPRKDHAICMVKFARDCRKQMSELVRTLEVTLGPGTGDLEMRFGLHSGPVTAGVLRGQKSRFQLFGDTVNTASRMESTGIKSRIQVSQTTATLLIDGGMGPWVKPRDTLIQAKGKGTMQTYWIEDKKVTSAASDYDNSDKSDSKSNEGTARTSFSDISLPEKYQRLVGWNTDLLAKLICQIMARRIMPESSRVKLADSSTVHHGEGQTVIDEVKEIIELPEFDVRNVRTSQDMDSIALPPEVASQLRDYVVTIATKYHNNPFHNFEHASHVGMSVSKLMSRIITPDNQVVMDRSSSPLIKDQALHDHTYGITSDPLTQFACVFAALVHDVDHPGVSNATLIQENAPVSIVYKHKSVAEQNSVDIAWRLLMEPKYKELREAICLTVPELIRFRQLVVNAVMATDIMDKDLKNLRNDRWEKAFAITDIEGDEGACDNVNRKATIVIEHLIQASDVAHTMQHWYVYLKWNERLFMEMYKAYLAGRTDKDPSEGWYQGELGFFDFYIIPLAKKLKNCGVFGVSSDEYLNYATDNRDEWEERGKEVVASMVAKLCEE